MILLFPTSPHIYSSWVLNPGFKMRCLKNWHEVRSSVLPIKIYPSFPNKAAMGVPKPMGFYEVKGDLEMLRNDGLGPEDPQTALKQRLLDLTKKNRRLQVTVDGQRVRLQQLEIEVKKPKEEAKKQAEEISFLP